MQLKSFNKISKIQKKGNILIQENTNLHFCQIDPNVFFKSTFHNIHNIQPIGLLFLILLLINLYPLKLLIYDLKLFQNLEVLNHYYITPITYFYVLSIFTNYFIQYYSLYFWDCLWILKFFIQYYSLLFRDFYRIF